MIKIEILIVCVYNIRVVIFKVIWNKILKKVRVFV